MSTSRRKPMTTRLSFALNPEVEGDLQFLMGLGYSVSEIGREGIRLFAAKKRAEAVA